MCTQERERNISGVRDLWTFPPSPARAPFMSLGSLSHVIKSKKATRHFFQGLGKNNQGSTNFKAKGQKCFAEGVSFWNKHTGNLVSHYKTKHTIDLSELKAASEGPAARPQHQVEMTRAAAPPLSLKEFLARQQDLHSITAHQPPGRCSKSSSLSFRAQPPHPDSRHQGHGGGGKRGDKEAFQDLPHVAKQGQLDGQQQRAPLSKTCSASIDVFPSHHWNYGEAAAPFRKTLAQGPGPVDLQTVLHISQHHQASGLGEKLPKHRVPQGGTHCMTPCSVLLQRVIGDDAHLEAVNEVLGMRVAPKETGPPTIGFDDQTRGTAGVLQRS
ncbi:hypothetical protein GWK47_006286 [Chionoecetes opilio]|uniref:Uncharacterized protein n=1 Tax=Chionoecetes opilio TaxID=41210 RepID=A0A8J5CTR5_CHIOP|nr:hypothetical protein GWK47_006286 [Chionoecetes opilio]